jgi:TPR repeat protein
MLSASELGDSAATIALLSSGMRSGNFRKYEKPLKRLGILAKEGNPRAMTLLGRTEASKGNATEALEWIRKATRGPAGLDFEEAGEALVYEGQLLMNRNREEAIKALRKAALELDEPSAYFYLAKLEKSGSPNQTVYFMKAASSGVTEASHQLGLIELSKAVKAADGNTPPDYGMAREWFQLAAADGYQPSMLSMCQICEDSGKTDEELEWRKKANKAKMLERQLETRK